MSRTKEYRQYEEDSSQDEEDSEDEFDFDQYVMNEIPIRLIRLSDMTLVSRQDVRDAMAHFRQSGDPSNHADKVKYATLSHRWGEGEPSFSTFEEMKKSNRKTPGFKKLENFCKQAKEYGMEFAWSDTCCIDKSSSAELDESIRCMYKWYEGSDVCIVHLAQSEKIEDILREEWKERGWTLQELLAPKHIKFFNKRWKPMTNNRNDKRPHRKSGKSSYLLKILQRATGIPQKDIRNFDPEAFKVDERMKWAAKRNTTRVEDVAYSLMGMFNVSLQIAYGEGGDRAFGRLVEAIMLAGDPSVLNWQGEAAEHPLSNAIPSSPQCFVGSRNLDLTYGKLETTMTSLGLRVPLVILPLIIRSTLPVDDGTHFTLECSLCPPIKIDVIIDQEDLNDFNRPQTQHAIGIVNYSVVSDGAREALMIRGKSGGFILFRSGSDPPKHSRPTNCVGLQFVPPPQKDLSKWEAVDQGLFEVKFPGISNNEVFYIDSKYLETIYV